MSRSVSEHAERPENDPMVVAAFEDRRDASDIYIVNCPWCGTWSYYNQGSHADCRNCGRDLIAQTAEMISMADYWTEAPYPCDEPIEGSAP